MRLGVAEVEESQPCWSSVEEGGMSGHEAGGWGGCSVCRTLAFIMSEMRRYQRHWTERTRFEL